MKKIVVTGANGFIGRVICRRLLEDEFEVTGTIRSGRSKKTIAGVPLFETGEIDDDTNWAAVLKGAYAIVHTAARVHRLKGGAADSLADYRRVNYHGTANLARQAAEAGIKRFIFLSSVKVNGETSPIAYTESDTPQPQDAYGISKMEAEQVLRDIATNTGMVVTTLRPPLVYGPNVRANFLRLLEIVDRGIPLPLGCVKNRRSLIFVENLADAIVRCIRHAENMNQTYLVRDSEDVTTPDLIRMMASKLGRPSRLFCVPTIFITNIARLLGKEIEAERIIGSLAVDDAKIRMELGWQPPYTIEYGLNKTLTWYKNIRNSCI